MGHAVSIIGKVITGLLSLWSALIVIGLASGGVPKTNGQTDYATLAAILFFCLLLPWLLWWAIRRVNKLKKLAKTPYRPTREPAKQETLSGMSEDSYVEFCQLAKMAMGDNLIEQDEATLLANFLHRHCGDSDSRTRHISIILDASLSDATLDSAEAEEIRVLLGEFLDAPIPQQPKTNIRDDQSKGLTKEQKKRKKAEYKRKNKVAVGSLNIGDTYDITYSDSNGNISNRQVHVRSISFNKTGNEIVKCHCFSANATRSFRRDRILNAVNIETGEICD